MQGSVSETSVLLVPPLAIVGLRLLAAIIIALFALRLAAGTRQWFERATLRSSADVHLRVLFGRFLYLVVCAYGLIWVVDILGISPTALVAGFGVLGLAGSLALQDILKSVCAGVYLLFERPFRIGDLVRVKDQQGYVADIGMRITVLHTEDGREVLVPNSVLLAELVVNQTLRHGDRVEPPRAPDASAP